MRNKEPIYRKARKQHLCDYCPKPIEKGEYYLYSSDRLPRYDENDKQVGIDYLIIRRHDGNCEKPVYCAEESLCEYVERYILDGYVSGNRVGLPTGELYCKKCGRKKFTDDLPF